MQDLKWYAVHTKAGREWTAKWMLRRLGLETLLLHYQDTVRHARRTRRVWRAYFPRYLFVQAFEGHIGAINRTPGVSTVVYCGDKPLEVPDDVIKELRNRGNQDGLVKLRPEERKKVRARYHRAQKVKVISGPMQGLMAQVLLDEGKHLRVWVEALGGWVQTILSPDAVNPVHPKCGANPPAGQQPRRAFPYSGAAS